MPTVTGILRMYKLGIIDHLTNTSQNGATIKIICPITDENADIVMIVRNSKMVTKRYLFE